ncbi:MAG: hypothetical protein ACFFE8_10265 [Candidatus Heimdallarchaeota archaeon]
MVQYNPFEEANEMKLKLRDKLCNLPAQLSWGNFIWLTAWLLILLVTVTQGMANPAGGPIPPRT